MKIHINWKYLIPIAIASLFAISSAQAASLKMILWYPGEAGSTIEAQPILDEFFSYLNEKIAPDTISGRYFNKVSDGLDYLKKERPAIGIVSYATFIQQKAALKNSSVFLSTLPSPEGKPTEQYVLVGHDSKIPSGALVLSSEPLSAQFVRSELFPTVPSNTKLTSTPQLIAKLKEIGDRKIVAFAILTPTEAATLAKISATWSQGIKIIDRSKPVPTARMLLFDPSIKNIDKIKAAFLNAGQDPKAREILNEMRLVGFAPSSSK